MDCDAKACNELWVAVIKQAIQDLQTRAHNLTDNQAETVRYEAFEFFLAKRGEWAESRRYVFAMLGLDEDAVREALADKLSNPPERPDMTLQYAADPSLMLRKLPQDRAFTAVDVKQYSA